MTQFIRIHLDESEKWLDKRRTMTDNDGWKREIDSFKVTGTGGGNHVYVQFRKSFGAEYSEEEQRRINKTIGMFEKRKNIMEETTMRRKSLNKLISCYHFFDTEEEARAFIKAKRWRKYYLSSNLDGTCWTLYHKERYMTKAEMYDILRKCAKMKEVEREHTKRLGLAENTEEYSQRKHDETVYCMAIDDVEYMLRGFIKFCDD